MLFSHALSKQKYWTDLGTIYGNNNISVAVNTIYYSRLVITYTVSFCQRYSYKTLIFEVSTTQLQLNINTYEMILQ